ncbi:MAG TPA: hypothetical protein VH854_05460 [Thermoanaerobaculia bacterium]|jgi:hypothetical protein|nr:hypothetical protein [Thermoanaerobaculia bacterium]
MHYVWTTCGACGGQITIQFARGPQGVTGSLRRWSSDRTVNDGRKVEIPAASVAADGGFTATCVCGAPITVSAAMVETATTERPAS